MTHKINRFEINTNIPYFIFFWMLAKMKVYDVFISECLTNVYREITETSGSLRSPMSVSYITGTQLACRYLFSDTSNKDVLFLNVRFLYIKPFEIGPCNSDRFMVGNI